MSGFGVLLKKELKEQLRSYRLLIVCAVFMLFGLATPLLVKYLPELIKVAGEEVRIEMPPPTAVQALQEYADSMIQIGVLVAVLVTMGAIAREREQGTAAMTLTKPVGRGAFVVAKLVAVSATFAIAIAAGAAACYLYTIVLFGEANAVGFLTSNLLMGLFFVVCLSITMLCSSFFKNQLAAGGAALLITIVLALISALPWIGPFMPGKLASWGAALVAGSGASAWRALAVSLALVILCIVASWRTLQRQEL